MSIAIILKEYPAGYGSEYELVKYGQNRICAGDLSIRTCAGLSNGQDHSPGDEDRYFLALIPATHQLDIR